MASVKMNCSTRIQPAINGSYITIIGFIIRNTIIVCLYQTGELPRKF